MGGCVIDDYVCNLECVDDQDCQDLEDHICEIRTCEIVDGEPACVTRNNNDYEGEEIECGRGVCANTGRVVCRNGRFYDDCEPLTTPTNQVDKCDGLDNDCDGDVDEDAYCNDKVSCTIDSCVNGTCVFTASDDACNDGVDCTDDSCDAVEGCLFTPNADNCDDKIDCTIDSCDPVEGCIHETNDDFCNDYVPCTRDFCDLKSGKCVNEPIHSACDDEIGCTIDECAPDADNADANGCVYEEELCNGECYSCEEIVNNLISDGKNKVGTVSYTYTGDYIFTVATRGKWIINRVGYAVYHNEMGSTDPEDFSLVEDLDTQETSYRFASNLTCNEQTAIAVYAQVTDGTNTYDAWMRGSVRVEKGPVYYDEYVSCCNTVLCSACVIDEDCENPNNPCLLSVCQSGQCTAVTTAISLIPTISVVKVNATVKVFWSAAMVRRSPLANLTLKSKKFATVRITIATERSITELLALRTPTLAPFMFVLVVNALLRMWSALLAMTCASSLSALTVLAVVSKTSLALELLLLVSNSSAPLELAALSHSSVLMMMTTSVPFTTASMLRARTFVSKRLATVPMMMMIVLFMSAKITNVKNKTFVTDLSLLLLRRTLLLLMFPLLVPCLILLNLCLLLRTFLLKLVAPPALLPVPLPSLVREMLIPSLSEAARPELSLFWD